MTSENVPPIEGLFDANQFPKLETLELSYLTTRLFQLFLQKSPQVKNLSISQQGLFHLARISTEEDAQLRECYKSILNLYNLESLSIRTAYCNTDGNNGTHITDQQESKVIPHDMPDFLRSDIPIGFLTPLEDCLRRVLFSCETTTFQ